MCLDRDSYRQVISSVSDERVVNIKRGDTGCGRYGGSKKLRAGIYSVWMDIPWAGGKLSGGTLKNKYLPGWRWMSDDASG